MAGFYHLNVGGLFRSPSEKKKILVLSVTEIRRAKKVHVGRKYVN